MTTHPPLREALACSVLEAVQATRAMGRVMLSAAVEGAIHERIGPVGDVLLEDGHVRLAGGAHDALIDLAVVTTAVADRSSRMRDRVLPRIELLDAAGETQFSLIALDGLEPFEAGVAGLVRGGALPEKVRPVTDDTPPTEIAERDAGGRPLHAARASGASIGVDFTRRGLVQSWRGVIADVKPIMGFFNIIQPDFHLHLKAGHVARWERREEAGQERLEAIGLDGRPIGLVLTGAAAAFAE